MSRASFAGSRSQFIRQAPHRRSLAGVVRRNCKRVSYSYGLISLYSSSSSNIHCWSEGSAMDKAGLCRHHQNQYSQHKPKTLNWSRCAPLPNRHLYFLFFSLALWLEYEGPVLLLLHIYRGQLLVVDGAALWVAEWDLYRVVWLGIFFGGLRAHMTVRLGWKLLLWELLVLFQFDFIHSNANTCNRQYTRGKKERRGVFGFRQMWFHTVPSCTRRVFSVYIC